MLYSLIIRLYTFPENSDHLFWELSLCNFNDLPLHAFSPDNEMRYQLVQLAGSQGKRREHRVNCKIYFWGAGKLWEEKSNELKVRRCLGEEKHPCHRIHQSWDQNTEHGNAGQAKTALVVQLSYHPHCPSDYIIVMSSRVKWSQKTFREIQIAEPRGDLLIQLLVGEVWLVNSIFLKGLKDK